MNTSALADERVVLIDPLRPRLDRVRMNLLAAGVGYVRVARSLGAARAVIPSARPSLIMAAAEQIDGDVVSFVADLRDGRVDGVAAAERTDFGLNGAEFAGFAGDLEELLQETKSAKAGAVIVYADRVTESMVRRLKAEGAVVLAAPVDSLRLVRAMAHAAVHA